MFQVTLTSYGQSVVSNLVTIDGIILLYDAIADISSVSDISSYTTTLYSDACGNIKNTIGNVFIKDHTTAEYQAKTILFYVMVSGSRQIVAGYSQDTAIIIKSTSPLNLCIPFDFSAFTNGFMFASIQASSSTALPNSDGLLHIENQSTTADDSYSVYSKAQTDSLISNFVTTNAAQTISGEKTFDSTIILTDGNSITLNYSDEAIPNGEQSAPNDNYAMLYTNTRHEMETSGDGSTVPNVVLDLGPYYYTNDSIIESDGSPAFLIMRDDTRVAQFGSYVYLNQLGRYYDAIPQAYITQIGDSSHSSTKIYSDQFIKRNGTSSQFLKADGSVDSTSYLTSSSLSNYVTTNTTQTITGSKTFNSISLLPSGASTNSTIVLDTYHYDNDGTDTDDGEACLRPTADEYADLGDYNHKFNNIWAYNLHGNLDGSASSLSISRSIDGVKFNGSSNIIHYGECSTGASTQIKDVTIPNFDLVTGARVIVKFINTNSASNPQLRVNTSGTNGTAKPIVYRGTYAVTTSSYYRWQLGAAIEFIYDGTNWVWVGFQEYVNYASSASSASYLATSGGYSVAACYYSNPTRAVIPYNSSTTSDLGTASNRWRTLYLSTSISDGTNTYSLPSSSGTLALTSDIPGVFCTGVKEDSYDHYDTDSVDYRPAKTSEDDDNPKHAENPISLTVSQYINFTANQRISVYVSEQTYVGSIAFPIADQSSHYAYYPVYFRGDDSDHNATVPAGSILRLTFKNNAFYNDFYDLADFGIEHEPIVRVGKVPHDNSYDNYYQGALVGIRADNGKFDKFINITGTGISKTVTLSALQEDSPIYVSFQKECFSAHPRVQLGMILSMEYIYNAGQTPNSTNVLFDFITTDSSTIADHIVVNPNSDYHDHRYFQVDNAPLYLLTTTTTGHYFSIGGIPANCSGVLLGFLCAGAENAGLFRLVQCSLKPASSSSSSSISVLGNQTSGSYPLLFTSAVNSSTSVAADRQLYTDTDNSIYYNPSTNTLTCSTYELGTVNSAASTTYTASLQLYNSDTTNYKNGISCTGNLLPSSTNTYSLGSSSLKWREAYFSGGNSTYYAVVDNSGGEPTIRPSTSNYGFLGTSSYKWYKSYINNLYLSNFYNSSGSYSYTLPSKSGTIALTSDIPSGIPSDIGSSPSVKAGPGGIQPGQIIIKVFLNNGTSNDEDFSNNYSYESITTNDGSYNSVTKIVNKSTFLTDSILVYTGNTAVSSGSYTAVNTCKTQGEVDITKVFNSTGLISGKPVYLVCKHIGRYQGDPQDGDRSWYASPNSVLLDDTDNYSWWTQELPNARASTDIAKRKYYIYLGIITGTADGTSTSTTLYLSPSHPVYFNRGFISDSSSPIESTSQSFSVGLHTTFSAYDRSGYNIVNKSGNTKAPAATSYNYYNNIKFYDEANFYFKGYYSYSDGATSIYQPDYNNGRYYGSWVSSHSIVPETTSTVYFYGDNGEGLNLGSTDKTWHTLLCSYIGLPDNGNINANHIGTVPVYKINAVRLNLGSSMHMLDTDDIALSIYGASVTCNIFPYATSTSSSTGYSLGSSSLRWKYLYTNYADINSISSGSITPKSNNNYSLGNSSYHWSDLYVNNINIQLVAVHITIPSGATASSTYYLGLNSTYVDYAITNYSTSEYYYYFTIRKGAMLTSMSSSYFKGIYNTNLTFIYNTTNVIYNHYFSGGAAPGLPPSSAKLSGTWKLLGEIQCNADGASRIFIVPAIQITS